MVAALLLTRFEWRVEFPPNPYLSYCWVVQLLTSRRMASSQLRTPIDRSIRMYSRFFSVRLGLQLKKPLGPRLGLARD